ncbi:efflux RND transporter periplasmic adaptor subunit [Sphingobacterium sp. MYb382]|uniref:efflux RND transporter periplasmic adaptor subunit n=1 Tax=Sphingobacterium sp. MYb382 TaxID=2745278 RepID=UPI0030B3C0CD
MNTKIILLGAVALIAVACSPAAKEEKQETKKAEGMAGMAMGMGDPKETITLTRSNPAVQLQLAGEIKPEQHTELFAKVNSYVKTVAVEIGDQVQAGQVLLRLEAPEIQSQLRSAKAKLAAQEALYEATKATYARMIQADETKGAIAKDALSQLKSRKDADEAQLQAARAAYNEIKDMDSYLLIRAPFSGTITARQVDVGAYVGPMNKEPLLVLENNQKLRLALAIPEASTDYIQLGDTIHFYVRSQPQERYVARVSRKSGSLDTRLRSERIEADFSNVHKALKPHMIAESTLALKGRTSTFFVPKMAIVESPMGMYVIRLEEGKTKFVPVRKGRSLPMQVEIFGELKEGDQVLKMANEEVQEGINFL